MRPAAIAALCSSDMVRSAMADSVADKPGGSWCGRLGRTAFTASTAAAVLCFVQLFAAPRKVGSRNDECVAARNDPYGSAACTHAASPAPLSASAGQRRRCVHLLHPAVQGIGVVVQYIVRRMRYSLPAPIPLAYFRDRNKHDEKRCQHEANENRYFAGPETGICLQSATQDGPCDHEEHRHRCSGHHRQFAPPSGQGGCVVVAAAGCSSLGRSHTRVTVVRVRRLGA